MGFAIIFFMTHKNNSKNRRNDNSINKKSMLSRFDDLHPETKKTALGVILLAFSILTALSYFQLAGSFGKLFFNFFNLFLGYGFFLIPILLLVLSLIFFLSHRPNLYFSTIFGAVLFLISTLALMEIFVDSSRELGGYLGFVLSYPLSKIFGFWGGMVILIAGIITSLAIIFNLHFKKFLKSPEQESLKVEGVKINGVSKDKEANLKTIEPSLLSKVVSPKKKIEEKVKVGESIYKVLNRKFKWVMPPFNLLLSGSDRPEAGDIKYYAGLIQKTLANFGILVEMADVNIGPTITQYTLKPAQGIKLSRITGLSNDLSLALAAHPIRIEAPIPGKSLVGVEIPNKSISLVRIRTMLEQEEFLKSSAPLFFPLGIDASGQVSYVDLASMPHLLICGSTGSGKSGAIHNILTSLLYKNSPEILKLILIDPKRVELTFYSDIPHLVSDVITQSKDAVLALRFLTKEMDKRYQILSLAGARDINSYNSQIKKDEPHLPYLVVIVDELADLMMSYPREVEASIVRLAQMARAVGIHLIISTQRPSVEVITGLIKANITSRIAFAVASQVDSRTILDMAGAEKLLGRGDMLYTSSVMPKPKRIQGSYITEEEVKKVTSYLRGLEIQTSDDIQKDLSEFLEKTASISEDKERGLGGFGEISPDDDDALYEEAKKVVIEAGKASASFLQRRLKIGYARAARMLDLMEDEGLISASDGAKPRMVLKDFNDKLDKQISN